MYLNITDSSVSYKLTICVSLWSKLCNCAMSFLCCVKQNFSGVPISVLCLEGILHNLSEQYNNGLSYHSTCELSARFSYWLSQCSYGLPQSIESLRGLLSWLRQYSYGLSNQRSLWIKIKRRGLGGTQVSVLQIFELLKNNYTNIDSYIYWPKVPFTFIPFVYESMK
jgi:hypothetical protein